MWVSFIMRKIAVRGDLNHLHRVVLPGLCLKMKVLIAQSCPTLWDPMNCSPPGSSVHGILQAWRIFKNTGMGSHSVLQGIFLTQGLNLGLPHCRQIFYRLSHQGSPVLVYLCLIILFSFSHLSCPKTLPNMLVQLFPKMDSTTQTCGSLGITCHGAATPPFCTRVCCQGSFLDLRKLLHVISLLQQSSAFATSFVLGISEGKQSFSCTPIDKHQLSSPGVHLFPTSVLTNIFLCDCFWLCPQPRSPLHSSGQDLQPHHASSL